MALPNVSSHSHMAPPLKPKAKPTRAAVAGNMSSNSSFGTSLLPSKNNIGNLVSARSTNGHFRAASGAQMSSVFNSGRGRGQVRAGADLSQITFTSKAATNPSLYGGFGMNNNMTQLMGLMQMGQQFGGMFRIGGGEKVPQGTNVENQMNAGLGNAAMKGAPVSGDIAGTIGNMTNATNSAELRTSISMAENQYNEMQSQAPDLQKAAEEAQGQLGDLQGKVGVAEENVKAKEGEESRAQQSVQSWQNKLESLNYDYAEKVKSYDTACTKLKEANDSVTSAEGELSRANAMPSGNAEQQIAKQAAVAKATAALNTAKARQTTAQAKQKEAASEKQSAYDAITENKEEIKKAEDNLNKSKEQVKKAQKEVKTAKKGLQEAQENLQTAKDAIEKFGANSKNMNDLQNAIKEQKKRLTKMEKDELKEYDKIGKQTEKANDKNDKLWDGIDSSDGMSNKEMKKLNKIGANNAANEARATRAAQLKGSVEETKALKDEAFASKLVGTGTEVTLQVGNGEQPIKGYYGKNPETGNMVYVDETGERYTQQAFDNWKKLAETNNA